MTPAVDDDPHGSFRKRQLDSTIPEMVPLLAVDIKIRDAIDKFKSEWIADLDRQALERARDEAKEAVAQIAASRAVSHRRWMKLIIAHGVTALLLAAVAGAMAMQWAYASTNRERIERLETQMDMEP